MLINNLELFLKNQEGDKLIFQTANAEEVILNKNLLIGSEQLDKVFLNLDTQAADDKKKILNELLSED